MASFHWLKEADKERKQLLSFCFVPTQREIENSKKKKKNNSKKFEKYHYGSISSHHRLR